jgi:hypothetical protein
LKDEALWEEEKKIAEIFIGEYNRQRKSDFHDPQSLDEDDDADVKFISEKGKNELFIQVVLATRENEERVISEQLKEKGTAQIEGNGLDEKEIEEAIQRKIKKHYSRPDLLILVVYTQRTARLSRDYRLCGPLPFREIWMVSLSGKAQCLIAQC